MSTKTENEEDIEGSTPSPSGPKDHSRHQDDSDKPSKVLKKEAIRESEKDNMTGKKGYNETPPTVPVK
ncbi:hypothetical protein [Dyadobacter aurulentus]|uniref:hypothetical protein n=1 Tax=Dyadobacter sp. UC 10 TaxID=2605428 RepID=UPI0011F1A5B8|nr:hypothetical protein [Dyadobacter sp. UC 10]KAA0992391.1 hypothetical protein FXO21_20500 [Dyadobacter sp. UC 10]